MIIYTKQSASKGTGLTKGYQTLDPGSIPGETTKKEEIHFGFPLFDYNFCISSYFAASTAGSVPFLFFISR